MINPFANPAYLLPPLTVLLVSLILVALIWRSARPSIRTRLFLGLLLSMAVWNSFIFGMRASTDIYQAHLWEKAAPVFFHASFVFYYHFTCTYTNFRGQRSFLLAAYSSLLLAAILSPTDLIIESMRIEYYGYAPVLGPVGLGLGLVDLLLMGGGGFNLLRRYRISPSYEERNRILYLIIALLFPIVGAFLDGFSNLPPAAIWANLIFCVLCSIAIMKYHLLDIRIIIRKSLAYLLVSIVIASPYVALLYFFRFFSEPALEPWWMHLLVLLLLAIILRPLYGWAQHSVDRLFYRERYDYLESLQKFSQQAHNIINLDELSSNMVRLIKDALRASNVCLLLPSDKSGILTLASCAGLEGSPAEILMSDDNPIFNWLRLHGDSLSHEQLNVIPQLQNLSLDDKNTLERMNARLYVPIRNREGMLSGVLILGEKLSQQPYSSEDRELLTTLTSQMSMALENAHLYELEKSVRKQLEKQDELKTEFLHSIAHELKTPLTAILSSSELLSKEASTTKGMGNKLLNNIRRGAETMDRRVTELLDMARIQVGELIIEPKALKVEALLKEAASQLLPMFRNKEQTLEVQILDSLSKVNADKEKFTQVLFNLLSNANKFSPSGSEIILRARQTGKKVIVEVLDTAPMVNDAEKKKLFDLYYRGEDVDRRKRFPGIGIGLAISKKIVELHHGEIWVETSGEKGNIFGFSIPALNKRKSRTR